MAVVLGLRRSVVVIISIVVVCVLGFVYLWTRAGGHLPDPSAYRISFQAKEIKNLVTAGDVRMAGVKVGSVYSHKLQGDHVDVVIQLDDKVVPLHEGATVRIGLKSVIGESMVVVKDGNGAALPSNSVLPETAVIPPVDVDEVINSFDPATRKALAGALTKAGVVTDGTQESFSQLMDAVGRLGREGYTGTEALAAQSEDFKALAAETTQILNSLDTNRAALVSLVDHARALTQATAAQKADLAASVQRLPGLMSSARTASKSLGGLGTDLAPVARDLNAAAPDLNAALNELPSVAHSLRALLPYMDSSFGRARQTLDQVPALAKNVAAVSPDVETLLRNVNPMLAYLEPYAFDVGSFFGNFGGSFDIPVENGVQPARLAAIFSEGSLRNNPLNLMELNPLHYNNPYPAPMTADEFTKFSGDYPRVTKDK